jgi:Ca2+-transporting ATPase
LVLVNRSFGASIITAVRRPNRALWWVLGTTAAILVGAILIPSARSIFRFGPLHWHDVAIVILTASAMLVLLEAAKRFLQPRFATGAAAP